MENHCPKILTLATENYALSLACLLISLYESNPETKAAVCLANWSKTLSEVFQREFPTTEFLPFDQVIKFHDDGKCGDALRLKVRLIHDHYFNDRSPFLWIDADSLVLNDLAPLFKKLGTHPILVVFRKELTPYFKFNLSTLGFSKVKEPDLVSAFLKEFLKHTLESQNPMDWFHDQWAFNLTVQSFPNLDLYPLSEKENSLNGDQNTIVYSKRNPLPLLIKKHGNKLKVLESHMNLPQRYGKRFYSFDELE